jgi:hypothetical protein
VFFTKILKKNFVLLLIPAVLILLFHLFSGNKAVMTALAGGTLPLRQGLARVCSVFPFSVAELLCTLAVLAVPAWLVWTAASVARRKPRLPVFLRRLCLLLTVVLILYLLLCLLLGASYRGESFQDRSGLQTRPETAETLAAVTALFARRLGETADTVERNENGEFSVPLDAIFGEAASVYRGAERLFPFLALRDVTPKRAFYSRLMSWFNYTGFYFPYTGEATVNVDTPPALIPATIAHEMAHQRGVASELEANFAAILACTESGSPAYVYSGWLFGFIHLGNALYGVDPDAYYAAAEALPEAVWADIRANDAYWAQFETKAAEVSDKVYDSMLKSYGQSLGVRSYGAVVDLLIAWYREGGFGA